MLYNANVIPEFPRKSTNLRGFIRTNYMRVDRSGKDSTFSYFIDKRSNDIKTKQYVMKDGAVIDTA